MMFRAAALALAFGCAALAAPAANASLTRAELEGVGVSPPADAVVPLQDQLRDLAGKTVTLGAVLGRRPALLILADYQCRELCGPILSVAARSLNETGLRPGQDFDLIVVGLNPAASLADAATMKAQQVDGFNDLGRAAYVFTGKGDAVASLERALNYRAVYDADSGRFAHPSDVFVLTAAGKLSRVLPGLALDPAELRLALVEAGQGSIGSLVDRVHLFCYGLDPAIGKATRPVQIALLGGGLVTVGALGLFVARARPRHRPIQEGGSA